MREVPRTGKNALTGMDILRRLQNMSIPEWVGVSEVLQVLWAEACGYGIPHELSNKELTTRTFVETKRKAQGCQN